MRGCAFNIIRRSGTAACVTGFGWYKMYGAVSVDHFHTQMVFTEQYHTMKMRRVAMFLCVLFRPEPRQKCDFYNNILRVKISKYSVKISVE